MTHTILTTVRTLTDELNSRRRDPAKLGVLARTLRWYRAFDAEDLAALLALGKLVRRKRGAGCWEIERAILEVLCQRAEPEHVPFLVEVFRDKDNGRHSDDRRRLALQALSDVAAWSADREALLALEAGLNHPQTDTRGWAIGFVLDSYDRLGQPLPQGVIDRLRVLAANDASPDVRVEAVTALASQGLVDDDLVRAAVAGAKEQAAREEAR
jgi:hypothetical protein